MCVLEEKDSAQSLVRLPLADDTAPKTLVGCLRDLTVFTTTVDGHIAALISTLEQLSKAYGVEGAT